MLFVLFTLDSNSGHPGRESPRLDRSSDGSVSGAVLSAPVRLIIFFFFCLPRNLPATTLRNRLWCISVGIPSRTVRRHQHRRPPVDGPFLVAPRRRGIRHRGHTRPETGAGRLERSRSPLQLLHASHARTQRDNVSIRPPCSESRLPRAKISKPQFGFIVFDTYFFLL